MIIKNHHFFILAPRPWSLIGRICSFNFFFSFLIFMKFNSISSFILNLRLLRLLRFFWWISYRREFSLEGKSSLTLESGVKLAIILFISSEIFFFFSFFWGYFHFFLSPSLEIGLTWPPSIVQFFDFSRVPLINTLILLSSGVTVTIAHFYLNEAKIKNFSLFLILTIFLGGVFTFLQLLEYNSSFFRLRDRSFGTSFFILTGFHGLHVIVGTIFLSRCIIRVLDLNQTWSNFLRFELASWYWHFVDVVWIFLYYFLYYFNC